jgi:uncharacterized protein
MSRFGVYNLVFSFPFFSILGWTLEVAYRLLRAKRFVNPGLLKGPYLILYGTASLILIGSVSLLQASASNLIIKTLVYFAATTGLELISGFIAQHYFHTNLWDYSDQRFNYKGHVCLRFSIYWILLAFAFEYLVLPPYKALLNQLSPVTKGVIITVTLSIMLVDFMTVSIKRFFCMTPEDKILSDEEFRNAAMPLLEHPDVVKLSMYEHHRGKTRLRHVEEVAYISFLWGKRLSLDCDSIVRGALLHDLFFYDWRREGPRFHGFRHPNIALRNARQITHLSKMEEDIIKRHMWPLTVVPPRYAESLVVCLVDTFCSTKDYLIVKTHSKTAKDGAMCVGSESGDKPI